MSTGLKWRLPCLCELKGHMRNYLGQPYLYVNRRIWQRLPAPIQRLPLGRLYGMHLHASVRGLAERRQNHSTFFLRNRPQLELIERLVKLKSHGFKFDMAVLACSKGAEVYSVAWKIRSARPDLRLKVHAIDISNRILEFAKEGVYSLESPGGPNASDHKGVRESEWLTWNTHRDQSLSVFERMTKSEMDVMFDIEGNQAKVKSWLKEGIIWHVGNASDPELVNVIGPQDMVMANQFLCHMKAAEAGCCLRAIARLVKPGGYLCVSGVDLDVRTGVAREMGWKPVTDLLREIHEGDVSLTDCWPLEYWGLEPFQAKRHDRMTHYASVFQLGESL